LCEQPIEDHEFEQPKDAATLVVTTEA